MVTIPISIEYEGDRKSCVNLVTTCVEGVVTFASSPSLIEESDCCGHKFGGQTGTDCDGCQSPTRCLPEVCPSGEGPFFVGVSTGCTTSSYYGKDEMLQALCLDDLCQRIFDCVNNFLIEGECVTLTRNDEGDALGLTIDFDIDCILENLDICSILDGIDKEDCTENYNIGTLWEGLEYDDPNCPDCEEECTERHLVKCGDQCLWKCADKTKGELYTPGIGMWLVGAVDILTETDKEIKYYLTAEPIPEMDAAGFVHWTATWTDRWRRNYIMHTTGVVEICVPGDYWLHMLGASEINKGIHAFRTGLAIIQGPGGMPFSANEWRGSAVADPPYPHQDQDNATGAVTWDEDERGRGNNNNTTQIGGPNNTVQFSMGKIIERWTPFSMLSVPLNLGARVIPTVKISSKMLGDSDAAIESQYSLVSTDTIFAGGGNAYHYQVVGWNDVHTRCRLVEKYGFKEV